MMQMRRLAATSCLLVPLLPLLLLPLAGCPKPIHVPSPELDLAPTVSITYLMKTRGTEGPSPVATRDRSGLLDLPTSSYLRDYVVIVSANNLKGGVQTLKLEIEQAGRIWKTVTASQSISPSGEVMPGLTINGTDGSGNPGPQEILVTAGSNPGYTAIVTATNFNKQTTSIRVGFNIIPGPPEIKDFSASPNNGYINAGDAATLTWDVRCGLGVPDCNVKLIGADGSGFTHQVLFIPALSPTGTFKVSPSAQFTEYTLTVTNAIGGASVEKKLRVQLYTPQDAPNNRVFYFRMNGSSQITSCFVLAVSAPDEATAKQLAEWKNGGFTATSITEQQFYSGC